MALAASGSKAWKRRVKGKWKQLRHKYVQARFGFGAAELVSKLRQLGLKGGDVVLVHSALGQFEAFTGSPREIIAALQQVVGQAGTVMMPTLSFTGTAVDYVRQGKIFDMRSTPSQTGMLTEIFRRSPGVVRSLHPTHSVAAWGADAAAMVAGHEDAKTPCGTGSPYMRLLEHDGKILFLGATYDSMTFWHAVEELIEGDMPFSPFTAEEYCAQARRADGITMECRMRLFEPKYSRARDLSILARELQAKGLWREVRTGGAPMLLVRAADVLNTAKELCARRIYCYAV